MEAKPQREKLNSKLLPGDCINSRSNTLLSKLIRKAGRNNFPDYIGQDLNSARVSHTALALGDGLCIESLWRVRINPISKYDGQKCVIWRIPDHIIENANPDMNPMQIRESVAKHALFSAGDSYGVLKIPLFLLDFAFNTYKFTSKLGISNFKVCSNLFAYVWHKHGNIDFGRDWRSISPDYLDDMAIVEKWDLVYSSIENL